MMDMMNTNERILSNYQKMYPNLLRFTYDASDDTLVFEGHKISLSNNSLSRIDPVFFEMAPEDIFDFLKYGFYQNTQDSLQIGNLFEQFVITEDEVKYLENFAKKYNKRCRIYANNKDLLDKLSQTNINVKLFCKELVDSHRVIYQAQTQTNASLIGNNAASILYKSYEEDLSEDTKSNNNQESKGFPLVRAKTSTKFNYDDFEAMEKEYIESKRRLNVAGFSSILLLLAVTTIAGVYLAVMMMS